MNKQAYDKRFLSVPNIMSPFYCRYAFFDKYKTKFSLTTMNFLTRRGGRGEGGVLLQERGAFPLYFHGLMHVYDQYEIAIDIE